MTVKVWDNSSFFVVFDVDFEILGKDKLVLELVHFFLIPYYYQGFVIDFIFEYFEGVFTVRSYSVARLPDEE